MNVRVRFLIQDAWRGGGRLAAGTCCPSQQSCCPVALLRGCMHQSGTCQDAKLAKLGVGVGDFCLVLLFFSNSLQSNGREGAKLWLGWVSKGCGTPTMGRHGLLGFPGIRGFEVGFLLLEGRKNTKPWG